MADYSEADDTQDTTPSPVLRVIQQAEVPFRQWLDSTGQPIVFTIVITSDGRAWFPIAALCRVLRIDARSQLDRLREHAVLSQLVTQLRISTAGGPQPVWCIERRGIGFWWGGLQLSKVRKEVRAALLQHQWALVDAADQLLSGVIDSDAALGLQQQTRALPAIRGQLATHDAQIDAVTRFALVLERRIGRLEEHEQ